jgi:hypothetical protein
MNCRQSEKRISGLRTVTVPETTLRSLNGLAVVPGGCPNGSGQLPAVGRVAGFLP